MKIFIFLLCCLLSFGMQAQLISGTVMNEQNENLFGANVYWLNTTIGVTTDESGQFEIPTTDMSDLRLVVSYVGYLADTLDVKAGKSLKVILQESNAIAGVVVKAEKDGVIISNLSAIKIEQITEVELGKAACCDLAGCFGTQATVQPQTTNVITNSKELRILGLSGVYNQVLIDGFPMIQGLTYTYGISGIPGTLVDNIFVSKGANSILQGYESISGQINVITKDPSQADKFFINGYMNSFEEKHINAHYAFKKGQWSNLTAVHSVQPAKSRDLDKDNFNDVPFLTRYMIFNKWKYGQEAKWGWNATIGLRFLNEKRIGGQVDFDEKSDKGSSSVYGQTVNINQPEIWAKAGYRIDDIHNFAFYTSAFNQDQKSYFGTVKYDAQQTNFYSNLQYELTYKENKLKTGFSFRHLDLNEDVAFTSNLLNRSYDGNYNRSENIPGLFAENMMQFLDKRITWIAGIRTDFHNDFGTMITPRMLLKYDFSERATIRANIGTGWRTVNLFSENINLLVSSRDVIFEEKLQPEEAINYGINYLQKFDANRFSGYFTLDYYRTDFKNQIFPDYDTDASKAIIKNYTGTSIGNGYQVEMSVKINERFDVKTGYNYLDVYRKQGEEKVLLPFNTKHRVLATFSYKPLSNKYHFDMNAHWNGERRLPNTSANPIEFQRPDFSEDYTVINAQFTYKFKKLDVYFGCENIFDFRQEQPIISWENPFGKHFDSSSVWGPTKGREFYLGFRYAIEE